MDASGLILVDFRYLEAAWSVPGVSRRHEKQPGRPRRPLEATWVEGWRLKAEGWKLKKLESGGFEQDSKVLFSDGRVLDHTGEIQRKKLVSKHLLHPKPGHPSN